MTAAPSEWNHGLPMIPWNIIKHCPVRYDSFISMPYLKQMASPRTVQQLLSGKCAWMRASGITKNLLLLCKEKLGLDEVELQFNRTAVLRSYYHTLFPTGTMVEEEAVSARFIMAKEALIGGVEACDSLETLPSALCFDMVAALEAHVETFGKEPAPTSKEGYVGETLRSAADIMSTYDFIKQSNSYTIAIQPETKVLMQAKLMEKIEEWGHVLCTEGKNAEFNALKELFEIEATLEPSPAHAFVLGE